jgi:hypothetical protein
MRTAYTLRGIAAATLLASVPATVSAQMGGQSSTGSWAPLGIPMSQLGSGTAWLPAAAPMSGYHWTGGNWSFMAHGQVFAQYIWQDSERGDSQFGSINWGMLGASKNFAGGVFTARGMISLEPFTVGEEGYPLVGQSGETFEGLRLHDRQHPHDLFMELALIYAHSLGSNFAFSIYAAPVGEPALGPVAAMHRPSAMNDPMAPLGHHWQDVSHITPGVATLSLFSRSFKIEGSIFNGREPDEERTDLDMENVENLDSYSGRITWNPSANWSFSSSYGYLLERDPLHPADTTTRITVSVLNERAFGSKQLSTAIIYGSNHGTEIGSTFSSVLGEMNFDLGKSAIFGRAEWVQKSDADLDIPPGPPQPIPVTHRYPLGTVALGYVRDIFTVHSAGAIGLGARVNLTFIPQELEPNYRTRNAAGAAVFLRVRPPKMGGAGHSMPGM